MSHVVRWWQVAIVCAVVAGTSTAFAAEPNDKAPAQTMTGEIQEHQPMMTGFQPNLTAMFNGIQFILKENTNLVFRLYTDTFAEAAKHGFMAESKSGIMTFVDVKGKKVEVSYTPVDTNVMKVISMKWLDGEK